MKFEWDVLKAATNVDKHGVSFHEAETVFGDPFELTIPDPVHSGSEVRWVSIGYSSGARLIVVVYTERGARCRVISARTASPRETSAYERRRR